MKKLLIVFCLGALAIFLCTGTGFYHSVFSEDTDDCIWTIVVFNGTNGLPINPDCDYIRVRAYTYGMSTEAWALAGPCGVFVRNGDSDTEEGDGNVPFSEIGADSDKTGSYAWSDSLLYW